MEALTTARISELRAFRDCPRKRVLSYEYELAPRIEAPYFAFGTAFHAGRRQAPWSLDPYEAARLNAILAKIPSDLYETKLCEVPFEVVVEDGLRIQGHIDAVVLYAGRYMVLERKTTSQALDADYFAALEMDDQVHGYYIGAQTLGLNVQGVLWEVVHKPQIRPLKATPEDKRKYTKKPKTLEDGTVRPAGSLYENQREFDETPEEFYERCLANFDPVTDYALREIAVTSDRLASFTSDTAAQLQVIRDGAAWRNPQACHDCHFTGICARTDLATETPDGFVRRPVSSPEASPVTSPQGASPAN